MPRYLRNLLTVAVVGLLTVPAAATPPNPIVSSLFVAIEGDIIEPGTTNLLHLTGEVHVVTHVSYSDNGVPAVGVWANLVRVRGTSQATAITYLAVGAGNVSWVGASPGAPAVPELELDFAPVRLAQPPRLGGATNCVRAVESAGRALQTAATNNTERNSEPLRHEAPYGTYRA